jgi:hypothetical protein
MSSGVNAVAVGMSMDAMCVAGNPSLKGNSMSMTWMKEAAALWARSFSAALAVYAAAASWSSSR